MDQTAWTVLFLEIALVVLLALLTASEAAIHAVRRPHLLDELSRRGRRGRHIARTIGERSLDQLASLQVLEFFAIFVYAGVAAAFIAPRLSAFLEFFFSVQAATLTDVSAVIVTVAVLSLIAVLFGFFVPRTVGAKYAQGVLLALGWPVELLTWVTRPVVGLLLGLTTVLTRPFGATPRVSTLVSEDEIKALVETGEVQGVLHERERDMIHSVFTLADKHVHEVMVPRTDIHAIDVDTPGERLLEEVVQAKHSRVPVYEGSADQIVGILYVRDLFRRLARKETDVSLRQYLRPAHFVPETKKVDELLREMQREKFHIAIVVDEYGGTAGLVTIEDLVEEVVGEIRDEYEADQEPVLQVSEDEAVMDARLPMDEVAEAFDIERETSEDYDTLGGFVVHALGRMPKVGETVRLGNVRFAVEAVEGRRIRRVRVTRERVEAEEEEREAPSVSGRGP